MCDRAGITPQELELFLHGTTVATNAVLEDKGARVGLIVTEGYRQIMQIARSFVPGGLAGWIVWPKPEPLAPLEDTIEIDGADGRRWRRSCARSTRPTSAPQLTAPASDEQVEAVTVCLINAYLNGAHERRVAELAAEIMPGVPVSSQPRRAARDAGI